MIGIDTGTLLTLVLIAVSAGIAGGILAGLLGVGGGIVIVPALYAAFSMTQMEPTLVMQLSVGTSLATIVFTSLSSSWGHYKRGAIDMDLLKHWAPAILFGVFLGAFLGGVVSGWVMIFVFATVALIVALDMIFRKPVDSTQPRSFSDTIWHLTGVMAGGISAIMGIGGGTICVPLLNFLGYDIRRAVGTSAVIGFLIGVPGATVYIISGYGQNDLPPFSFGYVNLLAAIIIIPFTVCFAHVGVWLAHRFPRRILRMSFGLFLLIVSARMFNDFTGHFFR